ncbi:MAG: HD domain-containing protein [Microthrixaceae bacterium]
MSLQPLHRARRFGRSLIARVPSDEDTRWAHERLTEGEQRLFDKMPAVDRSHSIAVARVVVSRLDELGLSESDDGARWILAAALTHDVGKSVAGLGTYGRVVATLSEAVGGASMARVWADKRGMTRKVGLYLQYPTLGADLLAVAGSDERVVAWAAQHHEPEESWTVPLEAGRILSAADDEAG